MRIWLKKIRTDKGLTQTETGRLSKISPQFYNFIENGRRDPSSQVAKRIAKTLGFPNEWYKLLEDDTKKQEVNYKARREKMQLSAEEAADLLGITLDEYRNIEAGAMKPSAEILEILPLVM